MLGLAHSADMRSELFDPEVEPVQHSDKQIFESSWQIPRNSSPGLHTSVRANSQQPEVSFNLERLCF